MIRVLASAALLAFPTTSIFAQESSAPTHKPTSTIADAKWSDYANMYTASPLCGKTEITLWTCETPRKQYSLCSSRVLTRKSGYIQYRVSEAGRSVFVFPISKTPPAGTFSYQFSANGDASVDFSNGDYDYSLVDPLRDRSAILVTKRTSKNRGATISCANSNQTLQVNYTMRLMYDSGLWPGN